MKPPKQPQRAVPSAAHLINEARWMVQFRQHHTPKPAYDEIIFHLNKSGAQMGGPAFRLALAVWNYDYRVLFPRNKHIVTEEENTFAYLCANHRSLKKSRVYGKVWSGMEAFVELRQHTFGSPILAVTTEPKLEISQFPLQNTLHRLDAAAHTVRNAQLNAIVHNLALANPASDIRPTIMEAAECAMAYAAWRHQTTSLALFDAFRNQTNALLKEYYKQRQWLDNVSPTWVKALHLLRQALSPTPP